MTFSLADLTDLILTWIVVYGPLLILGVLLLGALGAPVPGTFLVLAAGAFVRQGVLSPAWTPLAALAGAFLGDMLSYGMGRFARSFIPARLRSAGAWQKAEAELERRGGFAIYLTRWLLTPIAVPVNLVAGSTGYPFHRFLLYDVAGEITWVLLYGALGYSFSSQWEAISDFIGNFSGLLVGVAVLAIGAYLLFRNRRAKPALDLGASPPTT